MREIVVENGEMIEITEKRQRSPENMNGNDWYVCVSITTQNIDTNVTNAFYPKFLIFSN